MFVLCRRRRCGRSQKLVEKQRVAANTLDGHDQEVAEMESRMIRSGSRGGRRWGGLSRFDQGRIGIEPCQHVLQRGMRLSGRDDLTSTFVRIVLGSHGDISNNCSGRNGSRTIFVVSRECRYLPSATRWRQYSPLRQRGLRASSIPFPTGLKLQALARGRIPASPLSAHSPCSPPASHAPPTAPLRFLR